VARVTTLALNMSDGQIARQLNQDGITSTQGKAFNDSMVRWIRWRHGIPVPMLTKPQESTRATDGKAIPRERQHLTAKGAV
jgi:hypothetical protein